MFLSKIDYKLSIIDKYSKNKDMLLLDPKGIIATDEKHIMLTALYLMLTVVIPVIFLTLLFAWRYRAHGANKAKYSPEWTHSFFIEVVCWGVPGIIIAILAVITWVSSHELDPYRPLAIKNKQPLVIQAIALDWKWLFIYPEQQIATINFVQFPKDTPIEFLITAEGNMNSFIIPQLAGQIYAMAGMQATLYLNANSNGDYLGFSANFSGRGFSEMKFVARASSEEDFLKWIDDIKHTNTVGLTMETYKQLAKPTIAHPVTYYRSVNKEIFDNVVMQNMMPVHDKHHLCNQLGLR